MPKTDIKLNESEDVAELSNEALDEARAQACVVCVACVGGCASMSPSD